MFVAFQEKKRNVCLFFKIKISKNSGGVVIGNTVQNPNETVFTFKSYLVRPYDQMFWLPSATVLTCIWWSIKLSIKFTKYTTTFFLWISHPQVISPGNKEAQQFTNAINSQIGPVPKMSKKIGIKNVRNHK